MPRQNTRSFSNSNRNNSGSNRGGRSNRGKSGGGKFSKANNYNMLNFGTAFLDESSNTSYEFKARLMLKTKDGEMINVYDGDGKGENEYTPEESAALLAKALLEGRAINVYFFANDDGSWGGNARIDVNGLDAEEVEEKPVARKSAKAAPKAAAAKPAKKRTYEVPPASDDDDDDTDDEEETEVEDCDDDDMPY